MKASIKLRDDDHHHTPLLRAKFPLSLFSLPVAASLTAGDPSDLSFNLLTCFPSLPSLKLSYHPNASHHLSLSLRSGVGLLGSPSNSPVLISFCVSPNPNPSFCVHLKPNLGHFSLSKTAASNPNPSPNPNPKETGRLDELVRGGMGVRVTTAVPTRGRAGLKVRWAVKLPPAVRGAGIFGRLPYLSVDKISVERLEDEEEEEENKLEIKELGMKDVEAMKGMCFWMGRQVEELKNDSCSIKESFEAVRRKFMEASTSYGRSYEGVAAVVK